VTAVEAPSREPKSLLRSVARAILWPVRRFFDPRFTGIHEAVNDVKRVVIADMDATNEASVLTGRTLDTLLAHVEPVHRRVEVLDQRVEALHNRFLFDPEADHALVDLDDDLARILNYASSHDGFASQARLWFNPPVLVGYSSGEVGVRWVNERVAEVPYAFRALSRVAEGGRILDVGATESTVCLSLATLGFEVTAIDPRPNPLAHERLQTVVAQIEEWEDETGFDAVLCLSTIEHLGTGEYEQAGAERRVDLDAMKNMHHLTKPDGVLVLTTSVGAASSNEGHRVYDREGLDELLAGWEVEDLTLVQRKDATSWRTIDEEIADLDPETETVAMVTATKKTA
jgi:2-polyprenyl-3-methyl-5-hydroxy-6-metoxy-1,4-benzoquinol methylase